MRRGLLYFIYLFRTHQFSHLAIDNFFSQSSLAMWYVGMYHFLRHRKIVLTEVIIIQANADVRYFSINAYFLYILVLYCFPWQILFRHIGSILMKNRQNSEHQSTSMLQSCIFSCGKLAKNPQFNFQSENLSIFFFSNHMEKQPG